MKLYSAKIQLAASKLNEVLRFNLSAAEIALLRVLHGQESILDVKHTGNVNRADASERNRLAAIYSYRDQNGALDGHNLVLKYLGAPGVPLPQEVEFPQEVDENDEPEEIKAVDAEVIEPLQEPVAVRSQRARKQVAAAGIESLMA